MTKSLSGQLSEPLDVTETAVHQFVERLYIEAAGLFPDDWMHLGGDEGNKRSFARRKASKAYSCHINLTSVLWPCVQCSLDIGTTLQKSRDG
jgi:N-acetyl-beta-hexosaminidase